MNKNKYIQTVESAQLRDDIPEFSPGDTIVGDVRVVEGTREKQPSNHFGFTYPCE